MSFRQLFILKDVYMSIDSNRVAIKQEEHINYVPVEDIAIIIIDSKKCTFSSTFFSLCASKSIPILICGDTHHPVSLSLPINSHYRPYHVLSLQITMKDDTKEKLTEILLKSKLSNQKRVLELTERSEESISMMDNYINEIVNKDDINREGTAAKVFFNQMYGNDFVRFEDDPINSKLNYGYNVFAACISRYLSVCGINIALGVNHCGKTNPYNLVYDLIEPFRPIVDYYIFDSMKYTTDILNVQTKKELVNLLNVKVVVKNKTVTVQYAMEMIAKSYLRVLEGGPIELDIPLIQEINFNKLNESV